MSSLPDRRDVRTLGNLKRAGYRPRSVKDEIRANLIRKLRAGEEIFPGVLGYERTVIPQIQHALLARHDLLLLGLRGQAKTRIVRLLSTLLDEAVPSVAGSEIHDDPFRPISKFARERIADLGEATPIEWIGREARYAEKLATPDTSIADLIGDIDPIKAATRKLTYADEDVLHFGLIPRTHRGIFALNELPDLAPRIQVGLLNIMEEQDVQIRGFNLRLPLDLLMVFTANPEDYTNRGSIITPLKDRIDSQVLTHYPRTLEVGVAITAQEAWQDRDGEVAVHLPHLFREIVEQVAFEARQSEYVDQRSGVSARLTRAALEDLISAAERRALLNGEAETTVRPSDLAAIEAAVTGKVELVYEGEQEGPQQVARLLTGRAVATIFKRYFPDPADKAQGRTAYQRVLEWFSKGNAVELAPEMSFDAYTRALDRVDGLREAVAKHSAPGTPAEAASAMELVLEALHQHSLVGKDRVEQETRYTDLMGSVLGSLGRLGDDDDDADEDWEDYRRLG
jgi:magnesium chelatase subunit I